MQNQFNFVERFAPLSFMEMTVLEISEDKFIMAPADLISWSVQDDHVVVWYQNEGEDSPRFAQLGEFVNYRQVMTALLPIDLSLGTEFPKTSLRCLRAPRKRCCKPLRSGRRTLTRNATPAFGRCGSG